MEGPRRSSDPEDLAEREGGGWGRIWPPALLAAAAARPLHRARIRPAGRSSRPDGAEGDGGEAAERERMEGGRREG